MAFHYSPKVVSDGLVFCVDPANPKSYIGSGSYSTDIITKKTGSLLNGAYYSSDSFVFDGVNDYIDFGYISELDLTRFTVSVWYNPTTFSTWHTIIDRRFGSVSDTQTHFCIMINSTQVDAFTSNGSTFKEVYLTGLNITTNTWYNFILSYDGTSLRFYINGNLSGTLTDTFTPYTTGNQDMSIGRKNSTGGQYYTQGKISHTTIYNRALSQTEITQNFNALRGRFGI